MWALLGGLVLEGAKKPLYSNNRIEFTPHWSKAQAGEAICPSQGLLEQGEGARAAEASSGFLQEWMYVDAHTHLNLYIQTTAKYHTGTILTIKLLDIVQFTDRFSQQGSVPGYIHSNVALGWTSSPQQNKDDSACLWICSTKTAYKACFLWNILHGNVIQYLSPGTLYTYRKRANVLQER